jgi:hypothetical protein
VLCLIGKPGAPGPGFPPISALFSANDSKERPVSSCAGIPEGACRRPLELSGEGGILAARVECDQAIADAYVDGPEAYRALEAVGVLEASYRKAGAQFYYGVDIPIVITDSLSNAEA